MKKIKLITTLSSLGVLATATPIVATACNKNDDSNKEFYSVVTCDHKLPITLTQNESYPIIVKFSCAFYEGDKLLIQYDPKWECDAPQDSIFNFNENTGVLTINPDGFTGSTSKEYSITVKAQCQEKTLEDKNVGSYTLKCTINPAKSPDV